GLIGAGVSLAGGYIAWQNERYWIDDDGIHHRHGLLRVQETLVPADRVQGVATVRGPIQRLFGVLELRIQTAGGRSRAEIVLRAVSPADATELRAALRLAPAGDDDAREHPSRRLGGGGLLVTALTAGRFGVLAPI